MEVNVGPTPIGELEERRRSGRERPGPHETPTRSAAHSPAPENNPGLRSTWRNVKKGNEEDDFTIIRNNLSASEDSVLVLTPFSKEAPDRKGEDPYQYFGKNALLRRYSRIKHVPYTEETLCSRPAKDGEVYGGSYWRGHIMLAKAVIFVVNDPLANPWETLAADLAYTLARDDYKIPFVLILTNPSKELFSERFSHYESVVQVQDYSKRSLDMVAARIFGDMEESTST